jgi:hypothetical protein
VNRLGRGALLCGLLIAACGHIRGYQAQPQPDGGYRVDCRDRLTRCLTAMEEVCLQGYEIVQAHEEVRYVGPREFNEPNVSSFVIARCRTQEAVFGGKTRPAPGTPAPGAAPGGPPSAAPVPPTPRSCFPGATQTCVGPGACKGGQLCLPDGAAFGPCECGGTAAPPQPDAPGVVVPEPR